MADFLAYGCKLSWNLSHRARVQPLCRSRGRESSGTRLCSPQKLVSNMSNSFAPLLSEHSRELAVSFNLIK